MVTQVGYNDASRAGDQATSANDTNRSRGQILDKGDFSKDVYFMNPVKTSPTVLLFILVGMPSPKIPS